MSVNEKRARRKNPKYYNEDNVDVPEEPQTGESDDGDDDYDTTIFDKLPKNSKSLQKLLEKVRDRMRHYKLAFFSEQNDNFSRYFCQLKLTNRQPARAKSMTTQFPSAQTSALLILIGWRMNSAKTQASSSM